MWKIGDSMEVEGSFPHGNCIVKYSLTENGGEIEVYNPMKNTFLDNIAGWLLSNIGNRCAKPSDEWNEHGFSSEADYLRWRYG